MSATIPLLTQTIRIRGARTHNLRNVDVAFPVGQLAVVTGVSGSGKSSLAFDTLFAEGQRRYVESLSTYARQFIARLPRPDVDEIDHIPPAIALEQKNPVRNARSTIGTATEINDYLRLLWAKVGTPYCPNGHGPVTADTPRSVARKAYEVGGDRGRFFILAPIILENESRLEPTLDQMRRQGYTRLMTHSGEQIDLDDPANPRPDAAQLFYVIVDRVTTRPGGETRLADAVQLAFRMGQGVIVLRSPEGEELPFREKLACNVCGYTFRPLDTNLFSFSSPLGACRTCEGFGRTTGLDWDRIIPDPFLSLEGGAIAPWRGGETRDEMMPELRKASRQFGISLKSPWKDLSPEEHALVKYGRKDWVGVQGYFDWLETKRYKVQARIQIARYRGYTECPDCHGTRLTTDALSVLLGGLTIGQHCELPIPKARHFLETLELTEAQRQTAERPLREAINRLQYLEEVGLSYLTLSRQTRTLSGGEAQRINLATSLGSALTETLYVLDEPTVGLHPRDTDRLIGILERLRDLGNTIVVVEHDLDVIHRAEYLVDMGPGAGELGGTVIFQGEPSALTPAAYPESKTAPYLQAEERPAPVEKAGTNGKKKPSRKSKPATASGRRSASGWVTVKGAHENNLDYLTARFPLGVLCCVTGVSGSGKSTLVTKCLYGNYVREARGEISGDLGKISSLEGFEQVSDVVLVDQAPIGRSTRSNAATYLKAYDGIRKLLAESPSAKAMTLSSRDFSFNVAGGRCEACEGTGYQVIDMQFLADVEVLCDVCDGQRFQSRVLGVEWNGLNISQILALTVDQALEVFAEEPTILRGLQPLADVGLGYLRLGQATNTLSGGEAQRLKLAGHLAEAQRHKGALLIFDEPTTGLHAADIDVLLRVFQQALDAGFSLLVIEHNLELIRRADWVVDLGPEGGDRGGKLVAEGPPEKIAATPESLTGQHLAKVL